MKKIITIIVCLLIFLLVSLGLKNAFNININQYTNNFNSIPELINSTSFNLDIPEFIYKENNLDINSILGQIINISNEEIEFKASIWVDNSADPLGIYDKALNERMFRASELGITFLKYREDDKSTVINWVKQGTSYGCKFNKKLKLEEALDLLDIDISKLEVYNEEKNEQEVKVDDADNTVVIDEANIKYTLYYCGDKLTTQNITNDSKLYFINNKLALIVCYNNPNKYLEKYKDKVEYEEFNGVYFIYIKENPFNTSDEGFNDYKAFLDTIDDMLDSIDVLSMN